MQFFLLHWTPNKPGVDTGKHNKSGTKSEATSNPIYLPKHSTGNATQSPELPIQPMPWTDAKYSIVEYPLTSAMEQVKWNRSRTFSQPEIDVQDLSHPDHRYQCVTCKYQRRTVLYGFSDGVSMNIIGPNWIFYASGQIHI